MRTTIIAVFDDVAAALAACERLRELEGVGTLRLYLPGDDGDPVAARLVSERSPWRATTVVGVALGLACAALAIALGPAHRLLYALVALASGALSGTLLGAWLGGERYPRAAAAPLDERARALAQAGRMVAFVDAADDAVPLVRRVIDDGGGTLAPQPPPGDGGPPAPWRSERT
jgi:hypothetical protein